MIKSAVLGRGGVLIVVVDAVHKLQEETAGGTARANVCRAQTVGRKAAYVSGAFQQHRR